MNKIINTKILNELSIELNRQEIKWGIKTHSPEKWLVILQEEIGEMAKAYLMGNLQNYEKELIQVCAVALNMLDCHYRTYLLDYNSLRKKKPKGD